MTTRPTNLQALLKRPAVKSILVANLLLFPIGLAVSAGGDFRGLGLIPLIFIEHLQSGSWLECLTVLLRHQFFHVDLTHLFGNMLFLLAVGLSLESVLGALPFTALYLVCGMVSALGLVIFSPSLILPLVGASGAIAGLMGAALVLTSEQPFFQLPMFKFTVCSKHVILAWLFWQFDLLFQALGSPIAGQMVVHISGLVAGFAIASCTKN